MAVAKVDSKKAFVYLAVGFLVVSIWSSPTSTGNDMGNLLGDAGHALMEGFERGANFLAGLAN